MKIEFRREPEAAEVRVLVTAAERTPEVEALLRRIRALPAVIAYDDRGEVPLRAEEIIRIYTENRRVRLDSDRGSYLLRCRLYELEERLSDADFVRISNSEIVQKGRILRLDFGLTGTIRLILEGGLETYVSRRYVARIRNMFES